ncbi:MAG TPA: MBL fold metallo-hydrolase, partial [Hyphomonadaceae bacterium]|nr:MBL fold metallo-hydrolase [Hyphomonadaceae bacterium]
GLVIRHRKRIPVHMDQATAKVVMQRFGYCFVGSGGYPAILDSLVDVRPGQVISIAGPGGVMEVLPLALDHGGIASIGFRVKNFAYCNDVVRLPPETLQRLEGLDTLVVDALRHTPSPSHATVAQALDWIRQLRPRRAYLTNLLHELDYAKLRAELPKGVEPAYDGLELEIDPTG